MELPSRPVRFRLNFGKCIEGIDLLAQRQPGITQYFVCKVFFFADREFLLDWGRPISGDRFVAMEHGPVPSYIYDLLKGETEPDEIIDTLNSRVEIVRQDQKLKVYTKGKNHFEHLHPMEIEYLENALKKYGSMSFGDVRDESHRDPAYREAWAKGGLNNEMDIRLWLSSDGEDAELVAKELEERARLSFATAAE